MIWQEVSTVHQGKGGVYVKDGRIVSLLAIPGSFYRNEISREKVLYGISPKANERILKAFDLALSEGYAFRLFHRVLPGTWEDLGLFIAISVEERLVPFRTEKVKIRYYALISMSLEKGKRRNRQCPKEKLKELVNEVQ